MSQLADHVKALTAPVSFIGGHWMLHPDVIGHCRDFGYPNGYAYYVAGRGGVLGDVDSDVIAATFGFFEPKLVRLMWDVGVAVEGAATSAARYGSACVDFGRVRIAGFDDAERVAELAGRVADGAELTGLPLFAGWRAHPRPADVAGRAALLLHVLRELRGGVHLLAVVATGLGPRTAVFVTGGEALAKRFGWAEPFDDLVGVTKQAAEDLTDEILTRLYGAVLTEQEVAELVGLLVPMRTHFEAYAPVGG